MNRIGNSASRPGGDWVPENAWRDEEIVRLLRTLKPHDPDDHVIEALWQRIIGQVRTSALLDAIRSLRVLPQNEIASDVHDRIWRHMAGRIGGSIPRTPPVQRELPPVRQTGTIPPLHGTGWRAHERSALKFLPPARPLSNLPPWLLIIVTLCILILSTLHTPVREALPRSPLGAMERVGEEAQLRLIFLPEQRGQLIFLLATRRYQETGRPFTEQAPVELVKEVAEMAFTFLKRAAVAVPGEKIAPRIESWYRSTDAWLQPYPEVLDDVIRACPVLLPVRRLVPTAGCQWP